MCLPFTVVYYTSRGVLGGGGGGIGPCPLAKKSFFVFFYIEKKLENLVGPRICMSENFAPFLNPKYATVYEHYRMGTDRVCRYVTLLIVYKVYSNRQARKTDSLESHLSICRSLEDYNRISVFDVEDQENKIIK